MCYFLDFNKLGQTILNEGEKVKYYYQMHQNQDSPWS